MNTKHITITPDGYLATLSRDANGPGRVVLAKLQKLVFQDAPALGWDVRISGQHW